MATGTRFVYNPFSSFTICAFPTFTFLFEQCLSSGKKEVWSLIIKRSCYMKHGQMEPVEHLQRCHLIVTKLSLLQHLVYFCWSCTRHQRLPGDLTARTDKYALTALGEKDEKRFRAGNPVFSLQYKVVCCNGTAELQRNDAQKPLTASLQQMH